MARPQKEITYRQRRDQASNYTKKPEVRGRIFKKDNYCCVQCSSIKDLTIDHIISVYRGGRNDDGNLQTLCNICNSGKEP